MRNCLRRTHKMIWYYAPVATKQRDVSDSRLQRMHRTFSKSVKFPLQYRNSVIHCVSKNVPPLACYNFDAHEWILIFFGRNVTDKVGNQKTLLRFMFLVPSLFFFVWFPCGRLSWLHVSFWAHVNIVHHIIYHIISYYKINLTNSIDNDFFSVFVPLAYLAVL